ncbi:MAG: hypothetical protein ACLS37_11480 [Alistipes sp.]
MSGVTGALVGEANLRVTDGVPAAGEVHRRPSDLSIRCIRRSAGCRSSTAEKNRDVVCHGRQGSAPAFGFPLRDPCEYEALAGQPDHRRAQMIRPGDLFFCRPDGFTASAPGLSSPKSADLGITYHLRLRAPGCRRPHARAPPRTAKDAIDYRVLDDYRTHYEPCRDRGVELVRASSPRRSMTLRRPCVRFLVARLVRRDGLRRRRRTYYGRLRPYGRCPAGRAVLIPAAVRRS